MKPFKTKWRQRFIIQNILKSTVVKIIVITIKFTITYRIDFGFPMTVLAMEHAVYSIAVIICSDRYWVASKCSVRPCPIAFVIQFSFGLSVRVPT